MDSEKPTTDRASLAGWGWSFGLQGRETIYLFITSLALTAVVMMTWKMVSRSKADLDSQTIELSGQHRLHNEALRDLSSRSTQQHDDLVHGLREFSETILEQNYIILADEKERTEIKRRMGMPRSLRDKLMRAAP